MDDTEILNVLSEYSGKAKTGLAPPAVTLDTIAKCREYCKTDECGCYDKYCSCPPRCGAPQERLDALAHFSKCAIAPIMYELDYRNKVALKQATKDLQDKARAIMLKLKDKGLDCLSFADGGCMYCERCAALDDEPCRFPAMQIQSVSGNGILMMDFLKQSGIESAYREGHVEMYVVLLYN